MKSGSGLIVSIIVILILLGTLAASCEQITPLASFWELGGIEISPKTPVPYDNITVTIPVTNNSRSPAVCPLILKINGVANKSNYLYVRNYETKTAEFTIIVHRTGLYTIDICGKHLRFGAGIVPYHR